MSGKQTNNFSDGMNKDANPRQQQENTYSDMQNFVHISEDGNLFSHISERGTVDLQVGFPAGFKWIGYTTLDRELIVILADALGNSQVGVVAIDGSYTRAVPDPTDPLGDANSEYGFTLGKPVDCTARKLFTGERILYFTDNNVPFGFANLDDPPLTGEISQVSKLIPDQKVPIIDYVQTTEDIGNLNAGVYQFVTRYKTDSGTFTNTGIPSNVIPVVDEVRSVGRNLYDGASATTVVNKNIVIQISDIDITFPILQVIAISYVGVSNTIKFSILPDIPITKDTERVVFTGLTGTEEELTREEVRELAISYSVAKSIEQKDNLLFLSNLTETNIGFDGDFQTIANGIEVRYKVEEVEFVDGKDIVAPAFVSEGCFIEDPGDDIVKCVFNKELDTSVATLPLTNFVLADPGTQAIGDVTITSFADLLETAPDTITINTTTFTAQAGAATPGTLFFQAVTDNTTTATSLAVQINSEPTLSTQVTAVSSAGVVDIFALTPGIAANSFPLVYTDNGAIIGATVSAATLLGGIDPMTYNPDSGGVSIDPVETNKLCLDFTLQALSIQALWTIDLTDIPPADDSGDYTSPSPEIIQIGDILIIPAEEDDAQFTDYKEERLTFNQKGYRRDEVYSLCFGGIFSDGGVSFAYHIPGNDKVIITAGKNAAIPDTPGMFIGNTEGLCGTFVSSIDYPLDQNYPGNLAGDDQTLGATIRKVRHHLMPTLQQEPHFRFDAVTGRTFIRIIGLRFKFTKAIPQSLKDKLQNIYFGRQRRDQVANTSIFAQGLVDRFVRHYTEYVSTSGGEEVTDSAVYRKMPWFNNSTLEQTSITIPDSNPFAGPTRKSAALTIDETRQVNLSFNSPDTLFELIGPNTINGLRLEAVLRLEGGLFFEDLEKSKTFTQKIGLAVASSMTSRGNRYLRAWFGANYFDMSTDLNLGGDPQSVAIIDAQAIAPGEIRTVDGLNDDIYNRFSEQITYIETDLQVAFGTEASLDVRIRADVDELFGTFVLLGAERTPNNKDTFDLAGGDIKNNLMNIGILNVSQYGSVSNAEYLPIFRTTTIPNLNDTLGTAFDGDTFITKFAYTNKDVFQYRPIDVTWGAFDVLLDVSYKQNNTQAHGKSLPESVVRGADIRGLSYFFVESVINTAYRHRFDDGEGGLGVEYYPNSDESDTLEEDPREGAPISYNTQYSFENNVLTFFAKSADFKVVGRFDTRTIFSEPGREDDTVDTYRLFPQNNFHDIPKDGGEIWDTFVHNNVFYIHTPKSLWRAYVNTNAIIAATDVSEVVLGTGGLFTRPSEEVFTSDGGYAGTISQFGGSHTPMGYIFPDVLQGKIFVLGDSLQEISRKGMIAFFNNNLPGDLVSPTQYTDNPYNGAGIISGYDFYIKRFIICKRGTTTDFTVSYSQVNQAWASRHTYSPSLIIPHNARLFFVDNSPTTATFNEMNIGPFRDYFGVVGDLIVEFVCNQFPDRNKVYDNLIIETSVFDTNGIIQRLESFKFAQFIGESQNTGQQVIVTSNNFDPPRVTGQINMRFKNDQYRMAIPRDAVVDDTLDITLPSNLDNNRNFKRRMKSSDLVINLQYSSTQDHKFTLDFITTIFRINVR